HLGSQLFFIQLVAQFERLDVVKKFDDFFVGAITQSAQECRGQKLSTPFPAVEINIKQVSGIELDLDPRSAVRDDATTVEHFAVHMHSRFERDARRAMQLAHNYALRPIDHECPL